MSLYHETVGILTSTATHTGSLKSRIYGNKDLKSPPAQVYALAFEASKWSAILKEVVENAQLLQKEKKVSNPQSTYPNKMLTCQLTPALSVLLAHDLLLAKKGIALPASHGLRTTVEKHKARLQSEFTRARIRRKCPTVDALRAMVDAELGPAHPRWIRVNTLKSTLDEQLDTTFKGFEVVATIGEVTASAATGKKVLCLDEHVPNLIAASPGVDFTKTDAYKTGALILQDKASCFPAYLLDPRPEDGDVIDACSAPGNKTTHLAGILHERGFAASQHIIAFEKDKHRAKTLDKMVHAAGTHHVTTIHPGRDFLKADPASPEFRTVGALLLDPSCSGSGIVGRDDTPPFHLPSSTNSPPSTTTNPPNLKRKRPGGAAATTQQKPTPPSPETTTTTIIDDSGTESHLSFQALQSRLTALASFQLSILLHAFSFPAAHKVSYSTCSIHAIENEDVVRAALRSDVAKERGWRVLRREEQVSGMRRWEVRGEKLGEGDEVGEGCVRAERGDGRGTMGFFVACFVRDRELPEEERGDGPFVRDGSGRIVRDERGVPTLKSTGEKAFDLGGEDGEEGVEVRFEGGGEEGPFERDAEGRIVRDGDGMPRLKAGGRAVGDVEDGGGEEEEEEWGGFDE